MNIALDLGESYQRLIELEKVLDTHRNGLVHHEAVKQTKTCRSALHYQFVSLVDQYAGFAEIHSKEVQRFKHLLDQAVRFQEEVVRAEYQAYTASIASSPAPSASGSAELMNDDQVGINDDNHDQLEIASDFLASTALSAPVTESATMKYASSCSCDDVVEADNANESARKPAAVNTSSIALVLDEQDERKSTTTKPRTMACNKNKKMSNKKAVRAPSTKLVAVNNFVYYKYECKGFAVWQKNGQRPMYAATKLCIDQSFSDDRAGKNKLKRFAMQRGGLRDEAIKDAQIIRGYGMLTVRDSAANIERAVDRLNAGSIREVAWIHNPAPYVNASKNVNRRLFVTGFDILSAADHRRMSELFLGVGDLADDIFMSKDKNGNPFAMVTFREQRCATACVQNQNKRKYRNDEEDSKLYFNGKRLHIRYSIEEKKGKKKQNGRRFQKSN